MLRTRAAGWMTSMSPSQEFRCREMRKAGSSESMPAKSLQLRLTLCDPLDCSLTGSSVHGILQERLLKWVSMPSSRGSSRPRDRTLLFCLLHWQAGSLPLASPGKPREQGEIPTKAEFYCQREWGMQVPWMLWQVGTKLINCILHDPTPGCVKALPYWGPAYWERSPWNLWDDGVSGLAATKRLFFLDLHKSSPEHFTSTLLGNSPR